MFVGSGFPPDVPAQQKVPGQDSASASVQVAVQMGVLLGGPVVGQLTPVHEHSPPFKSTSKPAQAWSPLHVRDKHVPVLSVNSAWKQALKPLQVILTFESAPKVIAAIWQEPWSVPAPPGLAHVTQWSSSAENANPPLAPPPVWSPQPCLD